jgi:hypothetical protein
MAQLKTPPSKYLLGFQLQRPTAGAGAMGMEHGRHTYSAQRVGSMRVIEQGSMLYNNIIDTKRGWPLGNYIVYATPGGLAR